MGTRNRHLEKVIPWYLLTVVFLFCLFLQFSQSEAANLNVVGVNRNPAGTPAGTPPPPPTPVTAYYWTLEEDVMYPIVPGDSSTNWMAVSFHKSYMPIVASGCVSPTAGPTDPQCKVNKPLSGVTLDPNKRYFISVLPLQAGGYTNGGARIVASGNPLAFPRRLNVYVNKLPLPMAQISVFVTEDAYPINGFPDPVTEKPLEGFRVFLIDAGGRYGISGGPDAFDAFGNPLGTTYTLNPDGTLFDDGSGSPQVVTMGLGFLLTDANGMAILKNLPPGKLSILVLPPQGQEDMWSQTTTIEGTKVVDAWVKPNEPPYLRCGVRTSTCLISSSRSRIHRSKTPHTSRGEQRSRDRSSTTTSPGPRPLPQIPARRSSTQFHGSVSMTARQERVSTSLKQTPTEHFPFPISCPGRTSWLYGMTYCDIIINFSTVIVPDSVPCGGHGEDPRHQLVREAGAPGLPGRE